MAKVIDLNAQTASIRKHYETQLAEKDLVIEELRRIYAEARAQVEATKGVNQLLRLEIASLSATLEALGAKVEEAKRNAATIRKNLPEIQ